MAAHYRSPLWAALACGSRRTTYGSALSGAARYSYKLMNVESMIDLRYVGVEKFFYENF